MSDIQTQAALTANKLAGAAVGFALAAILIAYLQLFLGNLMSGQALWKTNQAAIGRLARSRSWRPSLRRVKVLYPKVSLEPELLMKVARNNRSQQSRIVKCRTGKTSNPKLSRGRPRATWAQIIQVFNITDASRLVEESLDADEIPSGLDVPMLRESLVVLARLALYMGCDTVHLDLGARELHAQGEICSMTTELVPTFGKAVRFEGDIATLMEMNIGNHAQDGVMIMDCMCLGQFLLGTPVEELKEFRVHLDVLEDSLKRNISSKEYYDMSHSVWPPDTVDLEYLIGFADEMETLSELQATRTSSCGNPCDSGVVLCYCHQNEPVPRPFDKPVLVNRDCGLHVNSEFTRWQQTTRFTRPSVMITATLAIIPGSFIGYPTGSYIKDLASWLLLESQQILQLDHFQQDNRGTSQIARVSGDLQHLAFDPKFLLYHEQQRMPFLGKRPAYSWLTTRLQEEYDCLPDNIKGAISSSKPRLRPAYDVKVLLMPWSLALLQDYRPSEWVKKFRRRQQSALKHYVAPNRLLWTQLVLLDISIRLQIKRDPHKLDGLQGNTTELQDLDLIQPLRHIMIEEGPEIVAGINESHTLPTSQPASYHRKKEQHASQMQYQPWDLHRALEKCCSFYDDMDDASASLEYERLAIMLKLRALFFAAFLLVGPDSSSVYDARNSEALVPII